MIPLMRDFLRRRFAVRIDVIVRELELPLFAQAASWGLLAGSGLLIGAATAVGFYGQLSHRLVAATMGFDGGVSTSSIGGWRTLERGTVTAAASASSK